MSKHWISKKSLLFVGGCAIAGVALYLPAVRAESVRCLNSEAPSTHCLKSTALNVTFQGVVGGLCVGGGAALAVLGGQLGRKAKRE